MSKQTEQLDFELEAWHVSEAAIVYGGSFFEILFGEALRYADIHNKLKIKKTWPDEWTQYLEMSKKIV